MKFSGYAWDQLTHLSSSGFVLTRAGLAARMENTAHVGILWTLVTASTVWCHRLNSWGGFIVNQIQQILLGWGLELVVIRIGISVRLEVKTLRKQKNLILFSLYLLILLPPFLPHLPPSSLLVSLSLSLFLPPSLIVFMYMCLMVMMVVPWVEGDFKHVKQVQPSDDDDPLPNETPILLLSFSLMGMAFLTSVSVIMKSKCLQREREKERKREREREREMSTMRAGLRWQRITGQTV